MALPYSSLNDDATKLVFNDVKDLRTFAQRKKTFAKLPTWVSIYLCLWQCLKINKGDFLTFFGLGADGKSPTHPLVFQNGKTVLR